MIIPMKKYSFLVYHKEYLDFLQDLRKVGVLHVIEKESGALDDENLTEQLYYYDEKSFEVFQYVFRKIKKLS